MKNTCNFAVVFAASLIILAAFPLTADAQKKQKLYMADTGIVALGSNQQLVLTLVNEGGNEPLAFCYQKIIWTFIDPDFNEFREMKRISATECIAQKVDLGMSGVFTFEKGFADGLQFRVVTSSSSALLTGQIVDSSTKLIIDHNWDWEFIPFDPDRSLG